MWNAMPMNALMRSMGGFDMSNPRNQRAAMAALSQAAGVGAESGRTAAQLHGSMHGDMSRERIAGADIDSRMAMNKDDNEAKKYAIDRTADAQLQLGDNQLLSALGQQSLERQRMVFPHMPTGTYDAYGNPVTRYPFGQMGQSPSQMPLMQMLQQYDDQQRDAVRRARSQ
jgi:hypothetical protein